MLHFTTFYNVSIHMKCPQKLVMLNQKSNLGKKHAKNKFMKQEHHNQRMSRKAV